MGVFVDKKAIFFGLGVAVAVALLSIMIWRTDGPATLCEGAGGQMLVGPGGETACISGQTFLPLEGFDGSR